jgi:hypothetical protein
MEPTYLHWPGSVTPIFPWDNYNPWAAPTFIFPAAPVNWTITTWPDPRVDLLEKRIARLERENRRLRRRIRRKRAAA